MGIEAFKKRFGSKRGQEFDLHSAFAEAVSLGRIKLEKRTDPFVERSTDYMSSIEKKVRKLQKEKPHLVEFSDKWMDVFQTTFVCGGHRCIESSAGLNFMTPISPYMTSDMGLYVFNDLKEEKDFLESVIGIKYIGKSRRPSDDENLAFNGCNTFLETYELTLKDNRKAIAYLDRDSGSFEHEGWLIIKNVEGAKPIGNLFEYQVPKGGIPNREYYRLVRV